MEDEVMSNGGSTAGPTGGQLGKRPLGDGEDAVEGGAFKEVKKRDKGEGALHRGSLVQSMVELEKLQEEARRLQARIRQMEDKTMCTGCKKRPAHTVFSPCSHTFCSEQGCLTTEVTECPQCNVVVTGRTRLGGPWHAVPEHHHQQQQQQQRGGGGGGGDRAAGARLGDGPIWNLRGALTKEEGVEREEVDKELKCLRLKDTNQTRAYIKQLEQEVESLKGGTDARCRRLLEQGLSQSLDADVKFVFDDGRKPLSGHRGMLCAASEEFAEMLRSGKVEDRDGMVRVPPGVSVSAFRGFLEWVYLGRCGEECVKADGRELWVLAEKFKVVEMKEWLVEEGINGSSVCAAYEFGLVPEGERGDILDGCVALARRGLGGVEEEGLRGVGVDAVTVLVRARVSEGGDERLGWRGVREGFELVERWLRANGGTSGGRRSDCVRIVEELDLMRLPLKVLRGVVEGSELVRGERLIEMYEGKVCREGAFEVEYAVDQTFGGGDGGGGDLPGQLSDNLGHIAVHGEGADQRIAVADGLNCRVSVFTVESGECVATLGSQGDGPGQFGCPVGVAFNQQGELFVSDNSLHRIQVFDRQGVYMRSFGQRGAGEGQLYFPSGLGFTGDGDIVVADSLNHRVQVLRQDGTFVRAFGSRGSGEAMFSHPRSLGVGAGGSIVVADWGNHCVQVFDNAGRFVRSIGSEGDGSGQFRYLWGVAVGGGGEIIVSDFGRRDVQVFSRQGSLLQTIGSEGDSRVDLTMPRGMAVDSKGRIFVGQAGRVVMLS